MVPMRDGQIVAATHEPERRFVTGLVRPNAPSRLETGAPPRFWGTNRERSFVDSLPEGEGRGRGNGGQSIGPMFKRNWYDFRPSHPHHWDGAGN